MIWVCAWLGRGRRYGGEWVRGLGLNFTNPVGIGGVWDVCLCLGCGGVGVFTYYCLYQLYIIIV